MQRRQFMKHLGTGALASTPAIQYAYNSTVIQELSQYRSEQDVTEDETFWHWVRQAYTITPGLINLNNAGVSPQTRRVQEAEIRYIEFSNETPSHYMWKVINKNREPIRQQLAQLCGASQDEIAINRNATEALDTIIFGLDLDKNDEVVACKQDYPLMIHAWNQRSQREGIELKWVDLKMPIEDEGAIIQAYTSLFTHRTKVVHLTHMINWTGQILPVKKIAAIAKEQGIKVVVDAAHSFAQLDFKLADLGADYAGVSLHKWLCAPFGTGMLYVKKENIADLWPLFPTDKPKSDDIRKFENLGTRSTAAEMAIGHAIEFHELIGASRKAARLQYLKSYWVEKALEIPQFRLYTSLNPQYGGAIVCCGLEGMRYVDLFNNLFKYHRIHTSPVKWDGVEGLRITPNVYTSLKELDKLVEALKILADSVKR